MAAVARPSSVIEGRDPLVLQSLLDFYVPPGARVLDVTANARRMWAGVRWDGAIVYADVDPEQKPDVIADFRAMPFGDASFDVIVFDPPHLPSAAGTAASDEQMKADYGLERSVKGDNVSAFFAPFLLEARRVLRPDGLVFAKLKDFVHNHKYQWSLADFVNAVRGTEGLTACDLRVKIDPCGGNLKSSKWVACHHARNAHCWWVVVRKGKCEASKTKRGWGEVPEAEKGGAE